jgi:hypothetical protein
LREQLAAKKSAEARPDSAQPKAEEDKVKVDSKPEEVSRAADEQQAADDEIAAGDGDGEHAGKSALLGKRGLEENETAAERLSKLPSKRERVSGNGEDFAKEEEPLVKEEGDSVMQLWSDLTDEPNGEPDPKDDPAAECKEGKDEVRSLS